MNIQIMSYPWSSLNTQNLDVQNNILIGGELIYHQSGVPIWIKATGLISRYFDKTDLTQDLSQTPSVPINFTNEDYNYANISFGGDFFRINDVGLFYLEFQCLLSNSDAQNLIAFEVNGTPIYSNLTSTYSGSSNLPFYISTTYYFNPGDELRVTGLKYNNGPNYLRNNPIDGTPITQLFIQRLTLS